MKNVLIICFFLILLFSCSEKKIVSDNILKPKEEMQLIIDSFVQRNVIKDYLVYELYIDKLDPENSNMILYAGDMSLTQKENEQYGQQPLMCVSSQGIKINVYSGIERYFENSFTKEITSLVKKKEGREAVYLAIKDSSGILNTYEIIAGYPFIPLPLENRENTFSRPIIKVD